MSVYSCLHVASGAVARASVAAAVLLLFAGCAQQQPVVYPRPAASAMAPEQAIDACIARADAYGLDYADSDAARRAAQGGVIGGAGGAVAGAIYGNWEQGALAGAASGATVGLLRGLFAPNRPAPAYRHFVARCLAQQGYDVIGWQ